MGLLLQIVRNCAGTWTVQGLPTRPVMRLASLTESIEFARRESHASPATIERSPISTPETSSRHNGAAAFVG
jgi:hypothetical protein